VERKKEAGLANRQGQGGGAKPRLSKEQRQEFKALLQSQGGSHTIGRMRSLAREHFGVNYGSRQMQRLARGLGKVCVGFADESSQQLYGNSARLWSFERGLVKKVNTDRKRRNCFGFYALTGRSVLNSIGRANQETMRQMLEAIREANGEAETIVVVWDNHSSHLTEAVEAKALEMGIVLVNLPTYPPDLNPIERIWKQTKKAISEEAVIKTVGELEKIISTTFDHCCSKLSFARSWIDNIYNQVFGNHPILFSDKL